MNFGTKLRTIFAVATALNTANVATAFAEFDNPVLNTIYKAVSLIALIVVMSANTYYNNDYTPIAAEYTGEMRAEKAELKGNVMGEYFHMDEEEEPEDEQ